MKTRIPSLCCLFVASCLGLVAISPGEARQRSADLVFHHGKIVSMDPARPEAQALAIRGDSILAVGTDAEIQRFVSSSTQIIDLQGRLVTPGIIEGHGHFLGLGRSKMRLNLASAKDFNSIVSMVETAARDKPVGEWITGRGWHQEKWKQPPSPDLDGLPFHYALSRVSPRHPVLLTHASGHACIANAKAMELAGITAATPDPPGGEIVRDPKGLPIGVFRESAMDALVAKWSQAEARRSKAELEADRRRAVRLASIECLSKGVTSFQDAGSSFETIDFFRRLADEGKLDVRLWVMIAEDNQRLAAGIDRYRLVNHGNKRLTVRAIKSLIDGALGAHGAWLLEPYTDLASSTGLNMTPEEDLRTTGQIAVQHGFQLCTHAIGDRANRVTLDVYEHTFRRNPGKSDLRWRIEHAQHLHPDDIPRFGRLGVIASMQGIHCTSDGPWVVKRLGEERSRQGAYVWKKLIQSGAVVSNGTDTPVEDVDPLAGFHALVTRRLSDGTTFFPEQRLSRSQALRAYTLNAAFAAFEEKIKGSLTPGKLADLVVWSQDIMTVPPDEIPKTRVLVTIVGGKVLYRK